MRLASRVKESAFLEVKVDTVQRHQPRQHHGLCLQGRIHYEVAQYKRSHLFEAGLEVEEHVQTALLVATKYGVFGRPNCWVNI